MCNLGHTGIFKKMKNYCGFSTKSYCPDVCGYHRRRNMGTCWGFSAVVARGKHPGFVLYKDSPPMGISIMKIRRSSDRLIFIMGIPILVRRHLYIETTQVDCTHERDCNAKLWCFLWCYSEQEVVQTVKLPMVWDAMTFMWHQSNAANDNERIYLRYGPHPRHPTFHRYERAMPHNPMHRLWGIGASYQVSILNFTGQKWLCCHGNRLYRDFECSRIISKAPFTN